MNNTKNKNNNLLNLQLISSIVFILSSLVSLTITFDEKNRNEKKKGYFTTKQTLNISFYNRIVILAAVLISFYVGYKNFDNEDDNTMGKYKSGLLFSTNVLTLIGSLIILYVSYLNKKEQSLTPSDVENPLI